MTVSELIIDLSNHSFHDHNNDMYIDTYDTNHKYETNPTIEDLTVTPCPTVTVQAPGAPEMPEGGCGSTKYSGDSINLEASPNGAIGPYHVRFWRMPNVSNIMTYGEIGSVRTVSEGSSTSTNFTLYDTDLVAASGNTTAGIPTTDSTGSITDPLDSSDPLAIGKIRVATTIYDSCPTGGQSCLSYCDVSLGCVAPTCNFTVM